MSKNYLTDRTVNDVCSIFRCAATLYSALSGANLYYIINGPSYTLLVLNKQILLVGAAKVGM